MKAKVQAGIALLEKLGCKRVPLKMPHTDYAIATYYIVATAEASSNLARYDGVRYGLRVHGNTLMEMYRKTRERGFGPEVKRRIMLGTYALSSGYYDAYYLRAQKVRSLIARDFSDAFEKVDAILTPTSPTPPFKLGEKTADPLEMYLADIYTVTGSLAGVPGISVPCGKTAAGLPIGMQIFASHFAEARILQLARAFEKAGGFVDLRRPLLKDLAPIFRHLQTSRAKFLSVSPRGQRSPLVRIACARLLVGRRSDRARGNGGRNHNFRHEKAVAINAQASAAAQAFPPAAGNRDLARAQSAHSHTAGCEARARQAGIFRGIS